MRLAASPVTTTSCLNLLIFVPRNQCDQKKSPNVYKSCLNMISLEKCMILAPLLKLPKALKSGPKCNKSHNLVTLVIPSLGKCPATRAINVASVLTLITHFRSRLDEVQIPELGHNPISDEQADEVSISLFSILTSYQ